VHPNVSTGFSCKLNSQPCRFAGPWSENRDSSYTEFVALPGTDYRQLTQRSMSVWATLISCPVDFVKRLCCARGLLVKVALQEQHCASVLKSSLVSSTSGVRRDISVIETEIDCLALCGDRRYCETAWNKSLLLVMVEK
jgi:hypothetical protein